MDEYGKRPEPNMGKKYLLFEAKVNDDMEALVLITPTVTENFVSREMAARCKLDNNIIFDAHHHIAGLEADTTTTTNNSTNRLNLKVQLHSGRPRRRSPRSYRSEFTVLPKYSYPAGVGIVLGLPWLSTLGSTITWNLRRRTIRYRETLFGWNVGPEVVLHGSLYGREKNQEQLVPIPRITGAGVGYYPRPVDSF